MKIKSISSKRTEWFAVAAIMFVKSLFVLPFFEQLILVIKGSLKAENMLIGALVMLGVLAFSLLYSALLIKLSAQAGEYSLILMLFAVADPLITVTVQNVFHALAAIIAIIWIGVCLKAGNKIAVAAVSVVSAALIAFIMPCAVFSFVLLGILVVLISASESTASKAVSAIIAVVSAVAAGFCAKLSSGELRTEQEFLKLFNRFGRNESHALVLNRIEYGYSFSEIFSQFRSVILACLPFVIFVFYVAVRVAVYKDGNPRASAGSILSRAATIAAVLLPFAGSAAASAICFGTGCVTGFILAPTVVIFSLALKGNKAVIKALDEVFGFAKKYPVAAFAAFIWMLTHTMAFVSTNEIYRFASNFTS